MSEANVTDRPMQQDVPARRVGAIGAPAAAKVTSRDELREALTHTRAVPLLRLGELLVQSDELTRDQLDVALQLQTHNSEKHLGEVLTDLGMLSKEDLYHILCTKLGVPFVDVAKFDIDANMLNMLPDALVRAEHVLPLCYHEGSLVVAVPDALDSDLLGRIRFLVDRPVLPVMAAAEEIDRRLGIYFGAHPGVSGVEEIATQLRSELKRDSEPEGQQIRETDNTLVRLVNKMIFDAHAAGASDIHIESNPERKNVLVRFRTDGELSDYLRLPHNFRAALVSRLKIMADLDISEHRQAQDGRINFRKFGPVDLELRVVIVPTRDGLEDVVMRLLTMREPLPITQLGLSESVLAGLRQLIKKPHGLILAVGPTGSGKTTTLHSLIGLINQPGTKIWTAENPVEITQEGLRQVQVNPKIGWDFATVMRAFLRADPDVIMVGEMRDKETAGIAVEASLTGHLVFSTLHTNSAAETVVRLLDIGIDPFSFTDSLLGVLGQRLARRLCTTCRKARFATEEEIEALAEDYCYSSGLDAREVAADWSRRYGPQLTLYEAQGCDDCRHIGYRGRVGMYELLVVTPEMRHSILQRVGAAELQRMAIAGGMRTMKQEGIEKCFSGLTDIHEVHAAAI